MGTTINRPLSPNIPAWWKNKPGDERAIICPNCKKETIVAWVEIDEKKLNTISKRWKKEVLKNPERAPIHRVSACVGYWKLDCVCKNKPKILPGSKTGLPIRFNEISWDDLREDDNNKTAFKRAKEWTNALPFPKVFGLYLFSPEAGTGKTSIAAACMNSASSNGINTHFLRASKIALIKEDTELEKLKNSRVLIIDDLDKVRGTDFGIERLFELIDHRHSEMLPTLITANMGPDAIASKYGSSLASRLCDKTSFKVVFVGGKDRRLI